MTNRAHAVRCRPLIFPLATLLALLLLHPSARAACQVVAWGAGVTNAGQCPDLGQCIIPADLTNALAVAAGGLFSLALKCDGTIVAWGDNSFGQSEVPANLSNVVAIAAGGAHGLALKSDGSVIAWGNNDSHQTEVPVDLTNAVAIAAGQAYSLALRSDGTLTAWGDNSSQQTSVPDGLTNVVAIAAGAAHSLALRANGNVVAWGENASQQTNVPPSLAGVVAIAAGASHSLALGADGTLSVWGSQTNVPLDIALAGVAILSTAQGDYSNTVSKFTAQGGDLVIVGSNGNVQTIKGRILANGAVNTNQCMTDRIAEHLYGTSSQIPDYTGLTSSNRIFDFNRFIAVSDQTHGHYTNSTTFITAMNALKGAAMEGVIVVDISRVDAFNFDPRTMPYGINVCGALLFNFTRGNWYSTDKTVISTAVNINPADLSHLDPADPSTFPTGYPPRYSNPAKNPINADISTQGYPNFTGREHLPALAYNTTVMDFHGPLNISGSIFSPSYMEIENKYSNQVQYIKGKLIGGSGIYLENNKPATSILSADACIMNIAACSSRNLALKADGTMACWGEESPSLPDAVSNVVAIATGTAHSLALVGDAPPVLKTPLRNPGFNATGFSVSIPTTSGRVYALEYKTSLTDDSWIPLPLVPGNGTAVTLTHSAPTSSQGFYRVRQW